MNHKRRSPAVDPTSGHDVLQVAGLAEALAAGADSRAVILVEGKSDQAAVETLSRRVGRDLDAEGISVIPVGGATTIGHFLSLLGPDGFDVSLAGLCDAGEEADLRRNLECAGFGPNLSRVDMETLGFFVCDADVESELNPFSRRRRGGAGSRSRRGARVLPCVAGILLLLDQTTLILLRVRWRGRVGR